MILVPTAGIEQHKNEFYKKTSKLLSDFLENQHINNPTDFDDIYYYFYDTSGNKKKDQFKKLLIGSRNDLKSIITDIKVLYGTDLETKLSSMNKLYKKFTSSVLGKKWFELAGIETCPYCNRAYVFTLKNESVRPEYDHYYPKSKYPFLCISMYNLVPSCGLCNRLKGPIDTYDEGERVIYPFEEEFGYDVFFKLDPPQNGNLSDLYDLNKNLTLKIENSSSLIPMKKYYENSIDKFRLLKLYSKHSEHITNIRKLTQIYTKDYLESLAKNNAFINDVDEAKNLVYLSHLNKNEWHKSILSKFTHDLIEQLSK